MPPESPLSDYAASRLASRIWGRDPAAFVGPEPEPTVAASIGNRLGWLDAPVEMPARAAEIEQFRKDALEDGLTDIYLLGMGGSSLCAEVLRDTLGVPGYSSRLTVLDTTDERAVRAATRALAPERSLFLVASKSGTTVEVTALERHFRSVVGARFDAPGRHFAAITDPDTELVVHAHAKGYRHAFINPADIGGRYSALSLFGLVPAALIGISEATLLSPAQEMADLCRQDSVANPGLQLGVFMGANAAAGRDKLTIVASKPLGPLGVWIEQLVAESTGKLGKGALPIVGELMLAPSDYADDRAFVVMHQAADQETARLADSLEAAGHPVFRIQTSPELLGAEFFRWEFATAVAGAVLGLNPFDEPNVRSAKAGTEAQLTTHRQEGGFRLDPPFETTPLYSRRAHEGVARPGAPGTYVAILDYLPADPTRAAAIDRLRRSIGTRMRVATTHGIGPRYLHSTGQYHKGGPNTGVFVLLTSIDDTHTDVPEAGYTFSTLKRAQALGDFDALVALDRTVVHCDFDTSSADVLTRLEHALSTLG